jgi:hypothetical protein
MTSIAADDAVITKMGGWHAWCDTRVRRHRRDPRPRPLVMDFAKTEQQAQTFKLVFARQPMGRPFLAPPAVPADRVAALRKAFMEALRDREFLAESEKMKLEINPVSGDEVQRIVQDVYRTPKAVAAAVADMLTR